MNQKISLRLYNKEKNSIHLGRKLLEFHSAPLPHAPINQNPTGAGTPAGCAASAAAPGVPAPVGFVPFTHPRYFV